MEKFVDKMLEDIFAGFNLQLNIVVGALLIITGIVVLIFSKKCSSKIKKTTGWICIGMGCLGALSGIVQLTLR